MRRIRETSVLSYTAIKNSISERHSVCLKGLEELEEATANELAMHLYNRNELPYFNRNFVHPRLTELVDDGVVRVVGKKKDKITNKKCLVYAISKIEVRS